MKYIFLLLISNSLFSQVILRGFVKDTLQNPLIYANVVAIPKGGGTKDMKFTMSDDIGYYNLNLKKNKIYFLEISFMGYKTIKDTISISKKTIKTFELFETANVLEDVYIDLPVLIKEDTIQYKIEKFINGKERKLKSVLRKLPGIEVSRNGNITILGKKVQGVLVDGKPFFGGGTKLAVENIPADAIKSVQALDNYNSVVFLKKVSKSDQMMLNIKLKEEKKEFIFGDVESRKGDNEFYDGHANLYYYSKKMDISSIINSNNVNKEVFSFKDFKDFNKTNVNPIFKNLKTGFSSFNSPSSLEDVSKSQQYFGALNVQSDFSDTMEGSGYVIYSNKNQQQLKEKTNDYFNFKEESTSYFNTESSYFTGKFSLKYTPNLSEVWDYKTELDAVANSNKNTIDSKFNNFETKINNNKNIKRNNFNQIVEFHKDYAKHIVSAIVNYDYKHDNPFSEWSYSKELLGENYLKQQETIKDQEFTTIFKDFWLINKDYHLHTTIGNSYKESSYNSINIFSENNLNFNFHDFFVGSKHHVRLGKTSVKLGIDYHHYTWGVNRSKKQKSLWLPNLKIETKFSGSKTLNFNYSMKSTIADVSKFIENPIYRSYNAVFVGDSNLDNELYHSFNIRFRRFNMYRGVNISSSLQYTKKDKGYANLITRDNFSRTSNFILVDNLSDRLSINTLLSKKIKKIRCSFMLNASNSNSLQLFDDQVLNNHKQSFGYRLYVKTFRFNPLVSLGFKQQFNFFEAKESLSKFKTNSPFVEFEYEFMKNFVLGFDYKYNNYINANLNQENNYQLANFDLVYHKEDSAWTFDCKVSNIFNSEFKQSNSFSNFMISDTKTYIMPRIILFGVSYKL